MQPAPIHFLSSPPPSVSPLLTARDRQTHGRMRAGHAFEEGWAIDRNQLRKATADIPTLTIAFVR